MIDVINDKKFRKKFIDETRIISMIGHLDKCYAEFITMFPSTIKEYKNNIEKRRACERTIQILIEGCIDICNLLVKELKLGLANEEEQIFELLTQKNVISEELALKLKQMKQFRNVLVHMYTDIDDELAYDDMKQHKDIMIFKKEIMEFIQENKTHIKRFK
ncbi:DUF86 domain-containing protein [Candidatus Woesearchaeota archaeon]|nr:DUF86 domain-containing protein [Candidatus Woesearchaeota archaeon]